MVFLNFNEKFMDEEEIVANDLCISDSISISFPVLPNTSTHEKFMNELYEAILDSVRHSYTEYEERLERLSDHPHSRSEHFEKYEIIRENANRKAELFLESFQHGLPREKDLMRLANADGIDHDTRIKLLSKIAILYPPIQHTPPLDMIIESDSENGDPTAIVSFHDISLFKRDYDVLTVFEQLVKHSLKVDSSFTARENQVISLRISFTKLGFLPPNIGNLQALEKLDLSFNHLQTLPESIGNLSALQELVIKNNESISLPDSIGNLINLRELNLSNDQQMNPKNRLATLPESIGNLKNLLKRRIRSQLSEITSNLCW